MEKMEKTATVLVADDDELVRTFVRSALEQVGLQVCEASNGQQVLEQFILRCPDIIVLDVMMPVMDGWEATRVIRELESLGRLQQGCRSPLPILAVTANAMEGDRDKCLAAGMNDYLTKPVKQQRLVDAVTEHLLKSRVRA